MKTKQEFTSSAVVAAMLLGLVLAGCQKPGPAEQAGKEVDTAVAKVGQQMEKAGDAIEKAAKSDKK
jgi:outer membrane murein-binding lipoprotein Lpp